MYEEVRSYAIENKFESAQIGTDDILSILFKQSFFKRIKCRWLIIKAVIKAMKNSKKGDIIFFWSPLMSIYFYMLTLGNYFNSRTIVSMSWLNPYKSKRNFLEKKLLNSTNTKILTKNSSNVKNLKEFYSLNKPIYFFPDIIDTSIITTKINIRKDYIFMGGYSNRDWELFEKIANRLQNINFVGVCAKNENLKLNFKKNVTMYYDIPKNQYDKLLDEANCILVLLKEDRISGFLNIIQSMQRGKICLCTNNDDTNLYYSDNLKEMCLVSHDINDCVNKILDIYGLDNSKYENMANEQQKYINKNFSSEKFKEIISDILRE